MAKWTIAIAGNPNSGKSSLFNKLTGSRQTVGNWPGVTVDKKVGQLRLGNDSADLVDLPGIYALNAWSEDERIARDFLLSGSADLVINVVDSANLERNLYLTRQLQEMGVPLLVVLNMQDLAERNGVKLHPVELSQELGERVVTACAVDGKKTHDLIRVITEALAQIPQFQPRSFYLPKLLQEEVEMLASAVADEAVKHHWNAQWMALKILEGDPQMEMLCKESNCVSLALVQEARERIHKSEGLLPDEWIADIRYQQIEGMLERSGHVASLRLSFTDRIDRVVMHKFWGFPVFLFMMYMVFWTTIHLGGAFIDFFDIAFGAIFVDGMASVLQALHAPEALVALVAYGVGAGVQTLSTFFPIIFILFFVIALLESSGYMSRAAFVMDRLMRSIGLPGKAFIPMLVGFGCTVPAIMATRSLENKRDRILSVFMVPFMSCGARLPVYALFAAAFFPGQGHNVVFALYFVGIVLAVFTGLLLKGTVYQGTVAPFILELPRYHRPQFSAVFRNAWFRLRSFIKKGGRVLIPIIAVLGILNSVSTEGNFGAHGDEKSVLSVLGKNITPVFGPMGIQEENWPASVGLLSGVFAKEVIVGSLNTLYAQDAQVVRTEAEPFASAMLSALWSIPKNLQSLGSSLLDPLGIRANSEETLEVDSQIFVTMRKYFHESRAAAIAYLIFVLLYVPCVVALSAAWKEVGGVLTFLQLFYSTALGWCLATFVYQALEGGSVPWMISSILLLMGIIFVILFYARQTKRFIG